MTSRKTREVRTVATEDAFGTPPAARGSMMNVAGASDEDQDLPLLTDEEVNESGGVRIRLGALRRLVRNAIDTGRR